MTHTAAKDLDAAIGALATALHSERLTINGLDDGSGVLLDVEKEQLMTLNPSAMTLVRAVEQGARTESALAEALVAQFAIDPARAEQDARGFMTGIAAVL